MTETSGSAFRPAGADDAPFLWRMLAEAADWRPETPVRPLSALQADPELSHYLNGWPRPGDLGVIAITAGQPVGAAWCRHFDAEHPGYGFVAPDVPELAVGVASAHRGRGIGRKLLRELIASATGGGADRLSLSVELGNPSRRLYERVGFVEIARAEGAMTMVLDLRRAAPPPVGDR